MKRSALFLAFVLSIAAVGIAAQGKDPDLEKVQKALKENLMKNAPDVNGVRFEQCRVSIRILPSENSYSPSAGTTPSSDFLKNEASVYLSTGPGNDSEGSPSSDQFEIDLSELNANKILMFPSQRKGMSRIDLTYVGEKIAIGLKQRGKLLSIARFSFAVKNDAAEKTAQSLQDAIGKCGSYKPSN